MSRMLSVVLFIVVLRLTPVQAAEIYLISAPIPGGAGGLACSCTNLGADTAQVTFILQHSSGGAACSNLSILSGNVQQCERSYTSVNICKVRRVDGKVINKKKISCTLSALDGSDNPIAIVPVDIKFRQQ